MVALAIAGCETSPESGGGAHNSNLHNGLSDAGAPFEPAPFEPSPGEPSQTSVGQAGAAGSEPGDVVATEETDAAPGETPDASVGEPTEPLPRIPLRSAAVGEAPVFDPGAVYFLGYAREHEGSSALSIAPVDHPSDSVGSFAYFVDAKIRRSDGRLLYQDLSLQDYLTEFLRDAPPAEPYFNSAGETVHRSSLPCDPTETEPPEGYQRRYLLSWDDVVYHTCAYHGPGHAIGDDIRVWYTADGELVYDGDRWLVRIGAQKRALAQAEHDLILIDLDTGIEVAPVPLDGLGVVTIRSHADGFTLALHDGRDGRFWLDIDLDGAVVARGTYAPLPQGVRYVLEGNALATRTGAIDAQGRLYELVATLEDSVAVIRRPRSGPSEVVYRAGHESDDDTLLHLGPVLLITGG